MKHCANFRKGPCSNEFCIPLAAIFFLVLIHLAPVRTPAQDIEPGAYSRAPVGTNFVIVTYAYQTGDILLDSSLPLKDVSIKFSAGAVAYGRTFGLFGKQTNIGVSIPYLKGTAQGLVFENFTKVHRSGLGDLRLRFSMNLHGSPALKPKEFAAYKRKTVVGASLLVIAPTGQYDPAKLVNIGANRWSFKPEIGASKPVGRWTLEGAAGVWLYTTNNNFLAGKSREQKPLASLQGDVMYTFRPKMWLAVGGTFYRGGRTVVNGVTNADGQSNSRYGGAFSYPFGKKHSLKLGASRGLTARFGGKLSVISIGWQYVWF